MALYEELTLINVLAPLKPYIRSGQFKITPSEDGLPVVKIGLIFDPENPWLHKRWTFERRCDLWTIFFNVYGIIPRGCRACWKVVMKIDTLRQLMIVHNKQKDFGSNCKCGIETRPFTGALGSYRAFFYAPLGGGLEGGRALRTKVLKEFPGMKIFLKRGCTEFENRFSPSDAWEKFAEKGNWNLIEDLAGTILKITDELKESFTPKVLEVDVLQRWIEYAFEHGDETHKDFIDRPMVPAAMKYCTSIHKETDLTDSIYEPIEKEISDGLDYNGQQGMEREGASFQAATCKEGTTDSRESRKEGPKITLLS